MTRLPRLISLLTCASLGGCATMTQQADASLPDASLPNASLPDAQLSPGDAAAPVLDCVQGGPCPELLVAGDAYGPPGGTPLSARGFADPSIRRDPTRDRLWMAYSLPYDGDGVVHVKNHLAHSDDDGASWTFDRELWTPAAESDPRTAIMGFSNHETVSLAPRTTAAGTRWVSARMRYFTSPAASADARTFQVRIAEAASPLELASAEEAVLGGAYLNPGWNPDLDLSTLSPELAGCTFFDAGVFAVEARVYMAVQCVQYTQGMSDGARSFVGVFATDSTGSVRTWQWRYLGKLTTPEDATALGGELLMQAELARSVDGSLLVLLTPSRPARPLEFHDGCRALAVASLDPPALVRDPAGRPVVRATVNATDTGTGSCGYDPTSVTGIVVARRRTVPGLLESTLAASGVRP